MEDLVIGYDIGKEYSQIACWNMAEKEPVSVPAVAGSEIYQIPTGDLEEFLKKSMKYLKPYGKLSDAKAIVLSLKNFDKDTAERVKNTVMQLGVGEEKIYVQTEEESFCSYVFHQAGEIWKHNVLLFSCEDDILRASLLTMNRKHTPCLARVEENEAWKVGIEDLENEEKDLYFTRLIREILEHKVISAVYMVGNGFEGKWYENSVKLLCVGRRVFAGNNLYAKGACFRASELAHPEEARKYIYFGANQIAYHLGIKILNGDRSGIHNLLQAGENWYDAKAECEVILYQKPVVEFIFQPILEDSILKETIFLEGLPQRPVRATRLSVMAEYTNVSTCQIQIQDLGFGEMFPATELIWTETIEL